MENTKDMIADIVADMRFERKKPPTKRKKAAYTAIKTELDGIAREVDALRLALWYAEHKRDYHKLSPDDIKAKLNGVNQRIDAAIRQYLSEVDSL